MKRSMHPLALHTEATRIGTNTYQLHAGRRTRWHDAMSVETHVWESSCWRWARLQGLPQAVNLDGFGSGL